MIMNKKFVKKLRAEIKQMEDDLHISGVGAVSVRLGEFLSQNVAKEVLGRDLTIMERVELVDDFKRGLFKNAVPMV